jgi:hypothetical protein
METKVEKNFNCDLSSEEFEKIKHILQTFIEPTIILQKISPRLKKSFEDRAKILGVQGETNFEILSKVYFEYLNRQFPEN